MKLLYEVLLMGLGLAALPADAGAQPPSPRVIKAEARTIGALTAVVSCQPTEHTEATLIAELRQLAGKNDDSGPGEASRLRLPAAITVLGMRTDLIAIRGSEIQAILPSTALGTLASTQRLMPHHYERASGRWIRPVAVRNEGNGWIRQRVIEVDADPQQPADLRVRCSEAIDSRRQQQARAGNEAPMMLPASATAMPMLGDVLQCRADRLAAATLNTSLLMQGPPAPPFAGWSDQADEGILQWGLPYPVQVQGVEVSSVQSVDAVLFGVVPGQSAQRLAQRWALRSAQNDLGETVHYQDMPVVAAQDGWQEHRRLWVLENGEEAALVGCSYDESVEEFGWWPGEVLDADGA